GVLPPAGPSCVPCAPVNDSKILLYSADCRTLLIASKERVGNCSATALLARDLYGRPQGVRDVDAARPPPCHGTHDRSPGMVGDQHLRSPFEQIERHW
ncbi:unnamed protein product, partial [Porites lobata]